MLCICVFPLVFLKPFIQPETSLATMSSAALDSKASFQKRALEIGLDQAFIEALEAGGVSSYGSLAFVSSYTPGQQDDSPLFISLARVIGRQLNHTETIHMRRLYFESSTLTVAELNNRVQRDDSSEPSKMPVPERVARLEAQKKKYPGLHYSSETEPSHKLVDRVCQFATDQLLEWIPWNQLTSRAQEVMNTQKEMKISFDANGALKVTRKDADHEAPLVGEIRVRQALARRARAFDLANLCSYTAMETWHEKIFELLQREPQSNALPIALSQLKEADQQLFKKIAEATRGDLVMRADDSKPMEESLNRFMDSAEVQFALIPQQRIVKQVTQHSSTQNPSKWGGKPVKQNQKSNAKGSAKGDGQPFQLPEGCHQKNEEGKPICNGYNKGYCKFAKPGKRCKRGLHICWKCFKSHPFSSCTKE